MNVPMILLVDSEDQAAAAQAVQKGVQDFLLKKEIDAQKLTHSMLCAMERHRFLEGLIAVSSNGAWRNW
jgi:AmiR/NasT family two-component response regulator